MKSIHPNKSRTKKADWILLLVLLLFAISFLLFQLSQKTSGTIVEVTVGKEHYLTLDLSEEYEGDIPGVGGGSNHLIIHDGKARISAASCPDQKCVQQGEIQFSGQPIICLPNQVVVQILSPS